MSSCRLCFGARLDGAILCLRDVTFAMDRGETMAIIGRNGCGKSTALKLIAGVMAPNGRRSSRRGSSVPLIELGAGFHPDLTGRENVHMNASLLGMSSREVNERFDEIVDFAELREFIDTPVKRYSSGMYVRLAFAVAVHSDPEVLLVDEVLSVGDAFFQEKCLKRMHDFQTRGTSILVVSHDLDLIADFCERAIWLEHGKSHCGRIRAEHSASVQRLDTSRRGSGNLRRRRLEPADRYRMPVSVAVYLSLMILSGIESTWYLGTIRFNIPGEHAASYLSAPTGCQPIVLPDAHCRPALWHCESGNL